MRKRVALKDGQFSEVPDSDIDYDFTSPNQFLGSHANLIPLQSAVQSGRLFYGARFANQALPVNDAEAPLVQLKSDDDPEGRSFDQILGESAGAVHSKHDAVVHSVTPDEIVLQTSDGRKVKHDLYNEFSLNRRTKLHNTPTVKPGDKVKAGQLLASSNFTDKDGTLAMGLNARTGLVPYLGHSMDDALVISQAFANRLKSNHSYGYDLDYKRGVKGGKAHYTGLFTNKFVNDQLDKLDDEGIVKPGQIVNQGDPIILATRPRTVSSTSSQLGLLSKHMKNARSDAAVLWEHETPGHVVDVHRGRSGVKLNIHTDMPAQVGDKTVFRSGQKNVISLILPDEHMPRTADGQPLEVLLNPLSVPSRVNPSLVYEMLLGKAAKKAGKPYILPAFTKPGESWNDVVKQELAKHGLTDTEEVFDPLLNKKLENPITVGNATVLKLSHTSASKISTRGQGSYDSDMAPLHGGGELGQSKRLSGLETGSLLSSGAYNVLREGATLRGTRNDQYWRELRAGHEPKEPGSPFVWDKFKALLQGSGYHARQLGHGKERLQFLTDADLAKHKPIKVKTGNIVDLNDLSPVPGGLFDPALTGNQSWGYVALPEAMPSPAAEDVVCKMLGLTNRQYRAVIAGEEPLPEHLQHPS
jgi:DNA-directed RNA polymerase subunit beta